MNSTQKKQVEEAKSAAIEVLLHNAHGPFHKLPRAAGWGYPEPYTRDMMITALGIMASGNAELMRSLRRVLETLAHNQSRLGLIPGFVHDPEERASSDTTPLFLLIAGIYRKVSGEKSFLKDAVSKARQWMDYQSPSDRVIVGQLPTSDWRDEQWILGFGLYVNTIVYSYLCLYRDFEKADFLENLMDRFTIQGGVIHRHVHGGLALRNKPYFAEYTYKIYSDERFDLVGNSLAILSGLASPSRSRIMIGWIERECRAMREQGLLALDLPPVLFPYIRPEDPDWRPRYMEFNLPGEYHNGGVWPFACGMYIAALVAAGRARLAEQKLLALTELVRKVREADTEYGFNEWFRAQDGAPRGQDWQTWSAGMYLYAAACVEQKRTPFFDWIRKR